MTANFEAEYKAAAGAALADLQAGKITFAEWNRRQREACAAYRAGQYAARQAEEKAIAADLDLCDLVAAIGDKKAKAQARKQRKACFAQIAEWNRQDGLHLSDDELLAALDSMER